MSKLTAVALAGAALAAVALPTASPGRGKLRVAIRLKPMHRVDLLAARVVPVRLRAKRGTKVRVAVYFRPSGGRRIRIGSIRKVGLRRGRSRRVTVPIGRRGRAAIARCSPARLTVRVRSRRSGRARSKSIRLVPDPPDCGRFFARGSFWNSTLRADAPLDPSSSKVTARLLRSVQSGFQSGLPPSINTTSYAPPVYTVPAAQERVPVHLDQAPGYAPKLEAAFTAVPLPPDARSSAGSDGELVVWQPATDTLWEFWQLRRSHDGWHAAWGGRLDHVSTGPAVFNQHPGESWGTSASGLPLVGGLILPGELRRGKIDHALALGVPDVRAGEYSLPAQRTDGRSNCPYAVPEGAHFRLDPGLDIDALGLAPPVAALARAAQRYGIIVRDQAGAVVFFAQNPSSLPIDPYPELFGGKAPWDLLATFPWSHLRLLRMQLVKSGGGQGSLLPLPTDCR